MTIHTVAIIDDHTLFAKSLKSLIDTFEGFEVTIQANNGKVFLEMLKHTSVLPDIALMDMNMPIMGGIETTFILQKDFPSIKVLALSMDDHENSILKMIKNGAKGYLLKDIHPDVLLEGLNSVIKEGFYHTKNVTETLINSLKSGSNKSSNSELNERELRFIKLASTEMTYKEIADVMNLSPKTIDGYREQLFRKLGVKNRVGLVIYCMKQGIV